MKNKFERLSKKEKKEAKKEFKDSNEINGILYKRIKRLNIIAIIGIIYSILIFLLDFLKENKIIDYTLGMFKGNILVNYIIDSSLLIFSIFFLIKGKQLLHESVNKFLIEKDKSKNKK